MPDVRAWGGAHSSEFQRDIVESTRQEEAAGAAYATGETLRQYDALAISGGGASGAFGAGFLNGWSAAGTRPKFKIVTGISTGALIAPFAFLGSDYDEELRQLYTTMSTKNIIDINNVFTILFRSESFANSDPLQRLVAEHIDEEMLQVIADRHHAGYRLYIGTTNMDAQRLSVWNMGRIATYGTEQALELFREILVASASIPAAMPPVMIEVEVDGRRYDEMHTDGGTTTQVFFYAGTIDLDEAAREANISMSTNSIYVIRNGRLGPEFDAIDRKLPAISNRALSTMIKTAALNNLFRIYAFALRDDIEFHYVSIPESHTSEASEMFDNEEMKRLYQLGYELALSEDPWVDEPPGLNMLE